MSKTKLDPKDFMFSNIKNQTLRKDGGAVNGQQFIIEDLVDCEVLLLDYTAQVTIDYCKGCRFLIGPCEGPVFIRNCENCTFSVSCRQFRTRDCVACDVCLWVSTDPIIETSHGMRFGPFNGSYDGYDAHFLACKLKPAGCDAVVHALQLDDPGASVAATLDVLRAADQAPSIKRVIVCSSLTAMLHTPAARRPAGREVVEEDWPTGAAAGVTEEAIAAHLGAARRHYAVTLAHAGFLVGPPLSRSCLDAPSYRLLLDVVQGKFRTGLPALHLACADASDVARAVAAAAAAKPDPAPRYICVSRSVWLLDVAQRLRASLPAAVPAPFQLPKFLLYLMGPLLHGMTWDYITRNVGVPVEFSGDRAANELGVQYRDPLDSVAAMEAHFRSVMTKAS